MENMENWKIVFSSTIPFEVNLAGNYLESEGIETQLQNELSSQINSIVVDKTKLLVKEKDLERGTEILINRGYIKIEPKGQPIELLEEDAQKDKTVCPYCGSKNISKTRESDFLKRIMFGLLGIFNPLFRKSYKCSSCKKEWKYN